MPVAPAFLSARRRLLAALASLGVLALAIDHAVAVPLSGDVAGAAASLAAVTPAHLVVSEVMTGGASASDEFIELYNPAADTLPLEGLEVVYVTATGATVTRKAAWMAGASGLLPGAHLLIANGAGVFAGLADVSYANGLAATGGSVALRAQGATTAIDAVGWGTAANAWLETRTAPAPAAGSSLERLPGGSSGSPQDTDDNLVDFTIQPIPDPQNSGSLPVPVATATPAPTATPGPSLEPEASASPTAEPTVAPTATDTLPTTPSPSESASPIPTAAATPVPTPISTPMSTPLPTPASTPTATPTPAAVSIAAARSLPNGTVVTIEGVTLTASDFADGGGYLIDATAGIAVLLTDGSFSRGQVLRVTGTVDDRYAQRTMRSSAALISVLNAGIEPLPVDASTGAIGEGLEGGLVEVTGVISSTATTLTTGKAWDLDDGSGAVRVLVEDATGIDTSAWARGVGLTLIGVVGQRDSSGSGISGFRLQPRDTADIVALEPVATPSPTPSPALTPQPTATPTPTQSAVPSATTLASATPAPTASATPLPDVPLVSIGEARAAANGMHQRIRGVVTAPSGLLEAGSAIVQDSTGAILVRLGGNAGSLALGQFVELDGIRSTKAGMLSLGVTKSPLRVGTQSDPEPLRRATGALGEAEEARLVIARGVVSTAVSHTRSGAVSFAIDDGSGPIRVTISPHAGIASGAIRRGAWLELRGVLGQETTAKAPLEGYRLWPRASVDLRVIAAPVAGAPATRTCCAAVDQPAVHQPDSGQLQDSLLGDVVLPAPGISPSLARPNPTRFPRSATTTPAHGATAPNRGPRAAGLVVSGMGLVALAGLAAWFGRRRGRNGEGDPQEERRILPPT